MDALLACNIRIKYRWEIRVFHYIIIVVVIYYYQLLLGIWDEKVLMQEWSYGTRKSEVPEWQGSVSKSSRGRQLKKKNESHLIVSLCNCNTWVRTSGKDSSKMWLGPGGLKPIDDNKLFRKWTAARYNSRGPLDLFLQSLFFSHSSVGEHGFTDSYIISFVSQLPLLCCARSCV